MKTLLFILTLFSASIALSQEKVREGNFNGGVEQTEASNSVAAKDYHQCQEMGLCHGFEDADGIRSNTRPDFKSREQGTTGIGE